MDFFYKIMNRSKSMSPITQNNAPQHQTKMNSQSNPGTPTQGFVKSRPNSADPLVSVVVLSQLILGHIHLDFAHVKFTFSQWWRWWPLNNYAPSPLQRSTKLYSFFSAVIIVWTLGNRPSSADCKSFSTTTTTTKREPSSCSSHLFSWVTQNFIIIITARI